MKLFKRIAIDALGYLMLVLAFLVGWIPGPGGTPLILGGLYLLSLNNPWAKKAREYFVREFDRLLDVFFPDHWAMLIFWDIAVVLAVGIGVYAILGLKGLLGTIVSSVFLAGALIAFGRNRRRFERFMRRWNNKKGL